MFVMLWIFWKGRNLKIFEIEEMIGHSVDTILLVFILGFFSPCFLNGFVLLDSEIALQFDHDNFY